MFHVKHRQVKRNGFHSGSSPELPFDRPVKIKKSEGIKMKEIMVSPEKYLDGIKKRACAEYLPDRISAEVLIEVIGISIEIYEGIQREK